MPRNLPRLTCFLVLLAAFAAAQGPDPVRLQGIHECMQAFAGDHSISGVVTLVAYRGKVAALDAVGFSDIEQGKPMRTDTIMQIMSQTKSFTGVAAMMLVEDGKLDLKRPVQDYLPEFQGQLVEEKRPDGSTVTRPPEHAVTVWQIMNHSSGMAFLPASGPFQKINFTLHATLAEAVGAYARAHLVNEPRRKYLYTN